MYAAHAPESFSAKRIIGKNRYDNLFFITDNGADNKTLAINDNAYLPAYLSGKFCKVSSEFWRDKQVGWNTATVDVL